jgi:putative transposase
LSDSTSITVPGQERFALDVADGGRFKYEGQELTISLVGEKEVVYTRPDEVPVSCTYALNRHQQLPLPPAV